MSATTAIRRFLAVRRHATTTVHGLLADQRGFSLPDLMLAVAILAIIITATMVLQQQSQQAYLLGSNRVETQQNARVALDLLTRELRSATSLTTINSNGGNPDITFVDQTGVTVRYCWSSSTTGCVSTGTRSSLVRIYNGTAGVLIGGVNAMAFTFYNSSTATYTGTTVGNVYAVRATLTTKTEESVSSGMPGDQRATMECTVQLRAKLS